MGFEFYSDFIILTFNGGVDDFNTSAPKKIKFKFFPTNILKIYISSKLYPDIIGIQGHSSSHYSNEYKYYFDIISKNNIFI